jgi:hypothetical protein
MQSVSVQQKSMQQDLSEIQAILRQRLGSRGAEPLLEDTMQ